MKTIFNLILMIGIFSSGTLMSQTNTSNPEKKSGYNKMYDEKTFTQIEGEITAVEQFVSKKGTSGGVHITVKTATETFPVHLGPKWYLDKQSVQLKSGDKIIVKGSKVDIDSKQTIIAKEVIKDGNTLILRDQTGKPVWAGQKP